MRSHTARCFARGGLSPSQNRACRTPTHPGVGSSITLVEATSDDAAPGSCRPGTIGSRKLGCADGTKTRICEGVATKMPQKSYFDGSSQIRCSFILRCPQPHLVGAYRRSPQCGIRPRGLIGGTRRLLDPYR